jgi:hypothetical protein
MRSYKIRMWRNAAPLLVRDFLSKVLSRSGDKYEPGTTPRTNDRIGLAHAFMAAVRGPLWSLRKVFFFFGSNYRLATHLLPFEKRGPGPTQHGMEISLTQSEDCVRFRVVYAAQLGSPTPNDHPSTQPEPPRGGASCVPRQHS